MNKKMLKLNIPKFDFSKLKFEKKNNVDTSNRTGWFDSQNEFFKTIGYSEYNTIINQTFDLDEEFLSVSKTLFPRSTVSIIQQDPGQTLPEHEDTFFMFSKNYGVDPKDCIRINIFLEDWKTGHYFEVNKEPVVKWSKGDAIIIDTCVPHLSGNMGLESKYTMQVTGIRNELKRR